MVKSFNAEHPILYLTLDREVGKGLYWADAATAEGRAAPQCEPCEIVISAAEQKRIQEKKKETLAEEEWKAPELAKTEGLIERVALPLLDGRRLAGVWTCISTPQGDSLIWRRRMTRINWKSGARK